MYLCLSLVERKVAEFYHNMVKMTYFQRFLHTIDCVLMCHFFMARMVYQVSWITVQNQGFLK